MPITRTTREVIASAEVNDKFEVDVQLLDRIVSMNVDDAAAFADEVMQAATEATLKYNETRMHALPPLGMDGVVIPPPISMQGFKKFDPDVDL